uniref:EB domain-containing protein n=1 Tax=Parastrongyloides trichosuri TaxID=131310 RepID=A0A0N5A376_PARTI
MDTIKEQTFNQMLVIIRNAKSDKEIKKKMSDVKSKEIKILIGLRKDAEIIKNNLDKQTFKAILSKFKASVNGKEEKREKNKLQFLSLWRQKMKNRIRGLMRKINRLEKKIKKNKNKDKFVKKLQNNTSVTKVVKIEEIPNSLGSIEKKKKKDKKHKKKFSLENESETNDNKLSEGDDRKEQRLRSFHLSKNISLNGLSGSTCQSHHECKPGLCCHKVKHPKPTDPLAVCVSHNLEDGSPCKHSCACKSGLQCFSPSKNPKIIKTKAICKKASTSDFINGVYENSKETVFDMDHLNFSS